MDPPYKTDFVFKSLELILNYGILNEDGIIVVETDEIEKIKHGLDERGIIPFDVRKYGRVYLLFIKS